MDLHICTVQHAGNLEMQVVKEGVTAPELALLRQIHGEAHVVKITKTRETKVAHRAEYDRLVYVYGPEAVARCFPGNPAMIRLPITKEQAGIIDASATPDEEDEEDPAVAASLPAEILGRAARAAKALA